MSRVTGLTATTRDENARTACEPVNKEGWNESRDERRNPGTDRGGSGGKWNLSKVGQAVKEAKKLLGGWQVTGEC